MFRNNARYAVKSDSSKNMTGIDQNLFEGGHYLGKPADKEDKIISRRVELVKNITGFCNRNLRLLEIGCGNGATLMMLSDEMKDCLGVDIYEGHRNAFEQLKNEYNAGNCGIVIKDIEEQDLPAESGKFDRLICFEAIEHFNDDGNVNRFLRWL